MKEVRLSVVGFEPNRSKLNEYYPMNVLDEYELITASVIVIDNIKEGTLKQFSCVRMMTRRIISFSIVLYGGLVGYLFRGRGSCYVSTRRSPHHILFGSFYTYHLRIFLIACN